MKRMLFVYNPHAGKGLLKQKLSEIVDIFVKAEYEVVIYPTQAYRDAYRKITEMSEDYDITPRKAASLLDTFSCVFQGIIPYGAQMLVAISAVSELGYNVTAFQILPKLFYPMLLLVSSLIWIYIIPERK